MIIFKDLFIHPFSTDGQKELLNRTKGQVIGAVAVFMAIQFIISILIPMIKLPTVLSEVWQDAKISVTEEIEKADFSYVGIEDDKLITDLSNQPYIVSEKDSSGKTFIFAIDSTGELDESILDNRNSWADVGGIAFLQDRMISKNSNGRVEMYRYADMAQGEDFSVTKNEILDFIRSGAIEDAAGEMLQDPQVILIIVVVGIVILLMIAAFSAFALLFWSIFVGAIAYAFVKKDGLRRYMSAFKLSIYGYFVYWYATKLVSYLPEQFALLQSFIKWLAIFAVVYFVQSVLNQIKDKKEEVIEKKDDIV